MNESVSKPTPSEGGDSGGGEQSTLAQYTDGVVGEEESAATAAAAAAVESSFVESAITVTSSTDSSTNRKIHISGLLQPPKRWTNWTGVNQRGRFTSSFIDITRGGANSRVNSTSTYSTDSDASIEDDYNLMYSGPTILSSNLMDEDENKSKKNENERSAKEKEIQEWASEKLLPVNDPLLSLLKLSVMNKESMNVTKIENGDQDQCQDAQTLFEQIDQIGKLTIKEVNHLPASPPPQPSEATSLSISPFVNYLELCLFSNVTESSFCEIAIKKSMIMSLRSQVRTAEESDGLVDMKFEIPHPFASINTVSDIGLITVNCFQVIKTLDATSRPRVVRLFNKDKENPEIIRHVGPDVLYKKGDDLRQDLLILSCISGCNLALRNRWGMTSTESQTVDSAKVGRYDIDVPQTPTYQVLPWGPSDGLIELVPDVVDQRSWVHDHPAEKWMGSAAASVVIAWLFGLGDRHQRNILSNDKGQVFNIDFGFVFGATPPLEGAAVPVTKAMYNDLKSPAHTTPKLDNPTKEKAVKTGTQTSIEHEKDGIEHNDTIVYKSTENQIETEELWNTFVELCMDIFDRIGMFHERQSVVLRSMVQLIEYQAPPVTPQKARKLSFEKMKRPAGSSPKPSSAEAIAEFYLQRGSSDVGRARFRKAVENAPFSFRSKFKEAIIPIWYSQVKRYEKLKKQTPSSLAETANIYRKKVQQRFKVGGPSIGK